MDNRETILEFLKELKYSYKDMDKIFTEGSCFRLYKILKVIFPTAKALYSTLGGHWITEIDGNYYDINGQISDYYVKTKSYQKAEEYEASAYIPTYDGQSCDYRKYVKTV